MQSFKGLNLRSMKSFYFSLTALILSNILFSGCAELSTTQSSVEHASLAALTYDGSQTALANLNKEITEAGKDPLRTSALVSSMVGVLSSPGVTFDAQQAICQRLGFLSLSPADISSVVAAVSPLLLDARSVNIACLALVPIPGKDVDQAFLSALDDSKEELKLAIVQALARRKQSSAIPVLSKLINDENSALANAAIYGLGEIGTRDALSALASAKDQRNHFLIDAKICAAYTLPADETLAVLSEIYLDNTLLHASRAAALRGLLRLEPNAVTDRSILILKGSDQLFKRVCIESLFSSEAPGLTEALILNLPSFDVSTKRAIVAVLGRRKERAALAVITDCLKSEDVTLRCAALEALGSIPCNAYVANRIGDVATSAKGEELRTAKYSISKLTGAGVSEAILHGASESDLKRSVFYIEALGQRNMTDSIPMLLGFRSAVSVKVRVAALDALSNLVTKSSEDQLLNWALAASEGQELIHAKRALVKVALLETNEANRGKSIIDTINQGGAEVQLKLISVLPKLNSNAALVCAKNLALGKYPDVSHEAIASLESWGDDQGLSSLVLVAEKSTQSAICKESAEAVLLQLNINRGSPENERADLLIRLYNTSITADLKNKIIYRLGRSSSKQALDFVSTLLSDSIYTKEAKNAVAEINANKNWPAALTCEANPKDLHNMIDNNYKSAWAVSSAAKPVLIIDLKETRLIREITLDQRRNSREFPEHLEVYVSDDLNQLGRVVMTAVGTADATVITLPDAAYGRYVVLKLVTHAKDVNWSITELHVD